MNAEAVAPHNEASARPRGSGVADRDTPRIAIAQNDAAPGGSGDARGERPYGSCNRRPGQRDRHRAHRPHWASSLVYLPSARHGPSGAALAGFFAHTAGIRPP